MPFTKATKTQSRLRLALIGPSGSGKTYSALSIATGLGGRVALIDTEHGSASKYADLFDFDSQELTSFAPEEYQRAITEASDYDVLIIDSLSHAWAGKDGILEAVDRETQRSKSKNAFTTGWAKNTPRQNALVDALVQARPHLIVTMRTKMAYVLETTDGGKSEPRKVGLAPIQREGVEYEFDVVGDLTIDLDLHITKSRCPQLTGVVINKPGKELANTLHAWLTDGAPPVEIPEPWDEAKWRKHYTAEAKRIPEGQRADFKADAEALGLVWAEPIGPNVAADVDELLREYLTPPTTSPEADGKPETALLCVGGCGHQPHDCRCEPTEF